jgi:uncharacterized protein YerC
MLAIFDTRASNNMISTGALKTLKNVKMMNSSKIYTNFDGTSNSTVGTVKLKFVYENKEYEMDFEVVKNPRTKSILLSHETVAYIKEEKKRCR